MPQSRYGAVVAVLAALSTVMSAGAAQACSQTAGSHCYGLGRTTSVTEFGGTTHLNVACLFTTSGFPTDFITAELWVGTAGAFNTGNWWVEEGMAYGYPQGDRNYWFWADYRPSYGYSEHDRTDLSVGMNVDYGVDIHYIGGNQWTVIRSGSAIGTSTSNSAPAYHLDAGTETTSDTARSKAIASSLVWRDSGQVGHSSWPSAFTIQNPPATATLSGSNTSVSFGANSTLC